MPGLRRRARKQVWRDGMERGECHRSSIASIRGERAQWLARYRTTRHTKLAAMKFAAIASRKMLM